MLLYTSIHELSIPKPLYWILQEDITIIILGAGTQCIVKEHVKKTSPR